MTTPDRRLESGDEVLAGAGPSAAERLRRELGGRIRQTPIRPGRRTRWALASLLVLALTTAISVGVAHSGRSRQPAGRFAIDVLSAAYRAASGGGVETTLTIVNPASTAVTVTSAALGDVGVQGTETATPTLHLVLVAGSRQEVTIHSDFDCLEHQPAVATTVHFTGVGVDGGTWTVASRLPPDPQSAAAMEKLRTEACQLPYPLSFSELTYAGVVPAATAAPRSFSMAVDLDFPHDPDVVPVTVTTLESALPGTRATLRGGVPVTTRPGASTRLVVDWTVTDCSRIPAYDGIPAVSATAADLRATETRYYALGDRYGADLARQLAAACH